METLLNENTQEYSTKSTLNNLVTTFDCAGERLGSKAFKHDYGLKYAYVAGAMYRGIASKEMVIKLGKAGLMGFLGTGGFGPDEIRADIEAIQAALGPNDPYGMNLICNVGNPSMEMKTVDVYIEKGVRHIEASAFMQVTPALVYYRLSGLVQLANGSVHCHNKVMAKVSHPEVARAFMSPPPERIVAKLLDEKRITQEQAQLAQNIIMANDICVEADSGGHTDQGIATVLLPSIQTLRKELGLNPDFLRIGLAGGIGTPEAIASAFAMGADFVLTGSINQCTVEAGTSEAVKDLLQEINVQDTDYAPAGDMFELGAKVQVLKKGVFFPARANRLYMLYSHYSSLDEIPEKIKTQIEEKYFKKSFATIWQETEAYLTSKGKTDDLERAKRNPKHKMALVFRWYFGYSARVAFMGDASNQVDYQIHTGPALGAFNQWVKGTPLENWRDRHVDEIGLKLMNQAAALLVERLQNIMAIDE